MRRRAALSLLVVVGSLLACASARADRIKVLPLSQQYGPQRASITAEINVRGDEPGRAGHPSNAGRTQDAHASAREDGAPSAETRAPVYPALRSNSPLLQDATPLGPGSFWYSDGAGHFCPYLPNSVLPCYQVVSPQSGAGNAALDPQVIAASIADRLPLLPGELHASPASRGLTGADSWFWLDPAPQRRELSVSLAGETVSVTAEPAIEWRFGDGVSLGGGPGRPYRAVPPPADAIVHSYETRCLPGDRGRNPYVLASCGSDGYRVEALVSWRISYDAAGRIDRSGELPMRTTETAIVYPVSEARAFLVGGAAG